MAGRDLAGGAEAYPAQQAATRRFSLGLPRSVTVAPDGSRLLFLRTRGGRDPVTCLWTIDLDGGGEERCLVDPAQLDGEGAEELSDAERARRERARELAGGITSYATDRPVERVAFVLGGRLLTCDVASSRVRAHETAAAPFDPRPSPDGRRVAYVSGDELRVLDVDGQGDDRCVVAEDGVAWGRAEFVAAEEMGRSRGHWWSPCSRRLAVARVDERDVPQWHLADPAAPWSPPPGHRYPAAGTVNADVRLALLDVDGDRRVDVDWDRTALPYLTRVLWDTDEAGGDRCVVQVQSRDQCRVETLRVDVASGTTSPLRVVTDDAWVELVAGSPTWLGERLVTVEDLAGHGPQGSRALVVDGDAVTPAGLQVRSVAGVDDEVVLVASGDDPTSLHVWAWSPDAGLRRLDDGARGVRGVAVGGGRRVVTTSTPDSPRPLVEVDPHRTGGPVATVEVVTETPVVRPRPRWLELGERRLRAALLLPGDDADPGGPLPVLLDPYGGPHAQRVLAAAAAFTTSQWLADQGFAVLVVDGRGTPGRGPAWERAVHGDLATPVLEDQLDALAAAAELEPRLDLARVGIRGWSFGGYLAALAALRAPDAIAAAVAGAPVVDWRWYDTHYTERYLGTPDAWPEAYAVSSLVGAEGELVGSPWPSGTPPPVLIVHGLADDNVVAAHALRLSASLLAAGWDHRFLPLSGVTHMTPQATVAENLLRLELSFLRETLRAG